MNTATSVVQQKEKKPFNKQKWRERKYSNKFKVQKWEAKRRRTVLKAYYRDLKEINADAGPKVESSPSTSKEIIKKSRLSAMQRARLEMDRQREEKQRRHEEIERQKEEREEALRQYRIKKAERFKRLSKKTKKGQPVMKDRMELLLEKIQRQCASE